MKPVPPNVAARARSLGLRLVPTGNAEPEIASDHKGRAHWPDGSRVWLAECKSTPENNALARLRHGLGEGDVFDLDLVGAICRNAHLTVLDHLTGKEVPP